MTMAVLESVGAAHLAVARRGPVLHALFSDALGGVETLSAVLAAQLAREGWPQEVVFLDDGQGPARARFHELPAAAIHACPYRPGHKLAFVLAMAKLVHRRRASGLVVYPFGFHPLVALGARLGGVRRVLACSGNAPPPDSRARRLTRLRAQLARPLVYREVAPSLYVAEKMVEVYGLPRHRVAVVHNACDVEGIAGEAAAARLEPRPKTPVFGMVARFDEIKDHRTLVQAFARLKPEHPSATLVLVGDGPMRPATESLAAELGVASGIRFCGAISRVAAELGRLDVFVMATTPQEGFGIAIVEALAAGLPVIASNCGPCPEVLEGGRLGLLVPPGDAGALAAAMARLWCDASLRQTLARVGPEAARERYSAPIMAARYRTLLED